MRYSIWALAGLLALAGCERPSPPSAPPTPTPVPDALIERAVRERTDALDRATEQGLANQRAAGDAARLSADIQRRLEEEVERRRAASGNPSPAQ